MNQKLFMYLHGFKERAATPNTIEYKIGERKEVHQNFPIRTGETAFLFLQHFIKILKAGGRGGIVIKNTFLSPQELWDQTFAWANAWRDRFAAIRFPDKSGSWHIRFYHEIATNRMLEAIATVKDRILLTLATGIGKTSIAFQIA